MDFSPTKTNPSTQLETLLCIIACTAFDAVITKKHLHQTMKTFFHEKVVTQTCPKSRFGKSERKVLELFFFLLTSSVCSERGVSSWDLVLLEVEFVYNSLANRWSTSKPFMVVHGFEPNHVLDLMFLPKDNLVNQISEGFHVSVRRVEG